MNPHPFSYDVLIEDNNWNTLLPDHEAVIDRALIAINAYAPDIPKDREMELSITLTNDAHIQDLNHDYRDKDKPTNVLSFPQIDWSEGISDQEPLIMLGDVVCALETIAREAKEQYKTLDHHFIHMLIHSVLHLFGYDHEDEQEAEEMEALEINILNKMGIKNPYQT